MYSNILEKMICFVNHVPKVARSVFVLIKSFSLNVFSTPQPFPMFNFYVFLSYGKLFEV